MKKRDEIICEIERNRDELIILAKKYNFNLQHKEILKKSKHIDKLLNKLNKAQE